MRRGPLARAKDAALERSLLLLIRGKFERYGEVRQLALDTSAKTISAQVWLRGDPIPIDVTEARYRVERRGVDCVLTVYGVKTTKEWLQNLLHDRFPEISVNVPPFVEPLL